jgi:hypothetical protein
MAGAADAASGVWVLALTATRATQATAGIRILNIVGREPPTV